MKRGFKYFLKPLYAKTIIQIDIIVGKQWHNKIECKKLVSFWYLKLFLDIDIDCGIILIDIKIEVSTNNMSHNWYSKYYVSVDMFAMVWISGEKYPSIVYILTTTIDNNNTHRLELKNITMILKNNTVKFTLS